MNIDAIHTKPECSLSTRFRFFMSGGHERWEDTIWLPPLILGAIGLASLVSFGLAVLRSLHWVIRDLSQAVAVDVGSLIVNSYWNETRYGAWGWKKWGSFKEFFCLRIHTTAERMPWTKSYLWSLASSRFFAGSMGERCAADFDSVGDQSTSFNSWRTHRCVNPCDWFNLTQEIVRCLSRCDQTWMFARLEAIEEWSNVTSAEHLRLVWDYDEASSTERRTSTVRFPSW